MMNSSLLSQVATQLATCGEALLEASRLLSAPTEAEPATVAEEAPAPEAVEAAQPAADPINFTDLRQTAADLSRSGHRADVKAMLGKYGCEKLSSLQEKDYPAFKADLEGIRNG
jgi:hypothetical protein